MNQLDVWFARVGSKVAFTFTDHGAEPGIPLFADSATKALQWVRKHGEIVQVGILSLEELGIE